MFSDSVKEKLLRVSGKRDVVDGKHLSVDGSSRSIKRSYTEAEIISKLRARPARLTSPGLRRRFLIRLAMSLHSYGSSAARTEYLIDNAADKLDIKANISVFPSLILLSFLGVDLNDPNQKEIHMLTADADLDVDKLGRANELANGVGNEGAPLALAYWRLKAIACSPPEFGKWWRLFAFPLSAAMSSLLFYNGSLWDALFSSFLGLAVGLLDILSSRSTLYASVLEFTAAFVVSFLARIFQVHFKSHELCYFSMALSALSQLLPGLSLILGVTEMVAKSHVTGTSRIMYTLFSSLQLGFGLEMGENLVVWAPKPVSAKCVSRTVTIWLKLICFCGYTFASNVLLNARLDQWPGMATASCVGYAVSEATSLKLATTVSSIISAFAVGITGMAYSRFSGDLPLVMVLSGILLLVPDGTGVEGVTAMLEDDVLSGMGFVFNMVVVALSIAIGLLLAKIALPSAFLGRSGRSKSKSKDTAPQELERERLEAATGSSHELERDRPEGAIITDSSDSDTEEDMAIHEYHT